jgi:hypothetical protein
MHRDELVMAYKPRGPRRLHYWQHRKLVWAHPQMPGQVRLRTMPVKACFCAIQCHVCIARHRCLRIAHLPYAHRAALDRRRISLVRSVGCAVRQRNNDRAPSYALCPAGVASSSFQSRTFSNIPSTSPRSEYDVQRRAVSVLRQAAHDRVPYEPTDLLPVTPRDRDDRAA